MRRAKFSVSVDLLAAALHMPTDARIVAARYDGRNNYGYVEFIAEDPDLP